VDIIGCPPGACCADNQTISEPLNPSHAALPKGHHRKASLFYKTENGAHVGDLFMSLIHTCELCKADPFDYLNELQRQAKEVAASPQNWMPWNYRETIQQSTLPDPP
jgi:hypothetical protein